MGAASERKDDADSIFLEEASYDPCDKNRFLGINCYKIYIERVL